MKSILVSYLGRNKVVDVPMLKEEFDVTFINKLTLKKCLGTVFSGC